MRPLRTGILAAVAMLLPLLAIGVTSGSATAGQPTQTSATRVSKAHAHQAKQTRRARHHKRHHHKRRHHKRHHRQHHPRKAAVTTAASGRPQSFDRHTVRIVRGINKITLTWPARSNATYYTVAWAPSNASLPSTTSACRYPCQLRSTHATSMTLSAADLSTSGRRVSSASGNTALFKVFAGNSVGQRFTSVTYPYDSWIGPSPSATGNWLPSINAQLPLPLPPAAGRNVSVASFNVLSTLATGVPSWATRAPRVVKQINATGAGIVATQEASNAYIPGRSTHQYTDLANRLRPSGWALADGSDWDHNLGASRSLSMQATRIYYKTNTWRKLSTGAFLTHAPINGQSHGVYADRWVSWTKLAATADSGTKVCVIDAHLVTNLSNALLRASADHRKVEISQILSELNNSRSTVRRLGTRVGAACAGTPLVFAADMNVAQGHAPYGNLPQFTMLGYGFVDTKNAAARSNTKWSGTGSVSSLHQTYGSQIDYILTRGMGGAKSFRVNVVAPGAAGSDHYPITTVVSVPRS